MSIKDLKTPWDEIALEEAEARGEARGELRGQAEAGRIAILDALGARFGPVPPEILIRVQVVADAFALRRLLRLAVTAPSLQSFAVRIEDSLG